MHIGYWLYVLSLVYACPFTCRTFVNKEQSVILEVMDNQYLNTKFGLMESLMKDALRKMDKISSKMDTFTDRLANIEKKMLYFEKELYVVKLQQQSSSGRLPQHQHVSRHVAPPPPLPINNLYFKRQFPAPRLPPKRTSRQRFIQSASTHQLSAPVLPSTNPDHQLSRSHGHMLIRKQDHSSAHPPDTPHLLAHLISHILTHLAIHVFTNRIRNRITHKITRLMTPLIPNQKIYPIP